MSAPQENTSIFKYMGIDFFKQLLENNKVYYKSIMEWQDPWENLIFKVDLYNADTKERNSLLANYGFGVYGDCWTLERDCKAFWDIYACQDKSRGKGVMIESTVGNVLSSLKGGQIFCNPVMYFSGSNDLVDTLNGIDAYTESGRYQLLCLKRSAFGFEREIRFMVDEQISPNDENIKFRKECNKWCAMVTCDLKILLHGVTLHPLGDEKELEDINEKLFANKIDIVAQKSDLYESNLPKKFNIVKSAGRYVQLN